MVQVGDFLSVFIVDPQPDTRGRGDGTTILFSSARGSKFDGAHLVAETWAKSVAVKKITDGLDLPHMRARTGCWTTSRVYR